MNALPIKPGTHIKDTLDDLIANHGLRAVLLTLLARITKRSRPPDTSVALKLKDAPNIDLLNDYLRADLGLPPAAPHKAKIDLLLLWGRHY